LFGLQVHTWDKTVAIRLDAASASIQVSQATVTPPGPWSAIAPSKWPDALPAPIHHRYEEKTNIHPAGGELHYSSTQRNFLRIVGLRFDSLFIACTALHCTASDIHCLDQIAPTDQQLGGTLLSNRLNLNQTITLFPGTLCPHSTALHCTALHCAALHCTALHCTTLHCTALWSLMGLGRLKTSQKSACYVDICCFSKLTTSGDNIRTDTAANLII
jgi:hypothetical protein